jgi:hypothetical protein
VLFLGGDRFFLAQETLEGVIVDNIHEARGETISAENWALYFRQFCMALLMRGWAK